MSDAGEHSRQLQRNKNEPSRLYLGMAVAAHIVFAFGVLAYIIDLQGTMSALFSSPIPREEWARNIRYGLIWILIVSVWASTSSLKWFWLRKLPLGRRVEELIYLAIAVIGFVLSVTLVAVHGDIIFSG
jgi:hypothetical protein